MKHFCRTFLAAAVVAISLASAAWGEVNVDVNIGIGIPGPPIVLPGPPEFIMPPSLGFYLAVGAPVDLYRVHDTYFLFHGNRWYRGTYYNGPWRPVKYNHLPKSLRRHSHDEIRIIRDKEYRKYHHDRGKYRGKHFKPNKAWKAPHKEGKKLKKEEHRDDHGRSHDARGSEHDQGKKGGGKGHGK